MTREEALQLRSQIMEDGHACACMGPLTEEQRLLGDCSCAYICRVAGFPWPRRAKRTESTIADHRPNGSFDRMDAVARRIR